MKLTEYDISHPYRARVLDSTRITSANTDEVRHITLGISDATFTFVEGQSVGVLVPGPHEFGNEQHLRLYSIASSRMGENHAMAELSICVRRCFYIDDVSGERYPGVASNYLCNRSAGDEISIAGPYGRQFLPPRDNTCNLLMIGVGTGIAPFRAFIRHIYDDRKEWKGKVRLFYGARTGMDLLYMNEENNDLALYYDKDTFKAFETLSPRPHADEPAQIERTVKDNAAEVLDLIHDPKTHVYVAGLSRVEEKLDEVLSELAGSEESWQTMKKAMVAERRWATLFYD